MSRLIILGALISGCGSSFTEYCEEYVDCVDGNEADERACVAEISSVASIADAYECKEQYDDYMSCMREEAVCRTEDGYDYWTDRGDCDDEESDLSRCVVKASDYYGGGYDTGG
jgi:hypothetical protein